MQGFEPPEFVERCTAWLNSVVSEAGAKGTISGLSGGIDSAVVAVLAREAGLSHRCLFLDVESGKEDYEDALEVARRFAIPLEKIDLTEVFLNLKQVFKNGSKLATANIKPRLRMIALYYYANLEHRLVLGTGNKTELMVGYFTKYGDGGVDLLPIGSLYKTQVRELAAYLGIPERIITKPPSAGLWQGQTDEGELGLSYEELDRILKAVEREALRELTAKNSAPCRK